MKKISVIVPAYNAEKYLKECIDSILCQKYTNLEIIIVNDGSVDKTSEIMEEYAIKDSRVRVITHENNQGLVRARFSGVDCAQGEYVTFVDADDWISEDMYSEMMSEITDEDVVISGIVRYHHEQKIIIETPYFDNKIYELEGIKKDIIPYMLWDDKIEGWKLDPSLCTKLFKKELLWKSLDRIKDRRWYYGEDAAVIYPLMLDSKKIAVKRQAYYFHRQRPLSKIAPYILDEGFYESVFQLYNYLKKIFVSVDKYENLLYQLDNHYMKSVSLRKCIYKQKKKQEVFPFWRIPKNAKVVIYGAGHVGTIYVQQNEKIEYSEIVLWVDKNYGEKKEGKEISSPDKISCCDFDYIIIAVKNYYAAQEIKENICSQGIGEEKIIFASEE